MLQILQDNIAKHNLKNVAVVKSKEDTPLIEVKVDFIFMNFVFHEVNDKINF